MERTLDFSGVTNYDFSLSNTGMLLELFQQDVVTKIKIEIRKGEADLIRVKESMLEAVAPKKKGRPPKMTENQVKIIRQNWEEMVKKLRTKAAAAEYFGKLYNCSAKNIYAIVYRYSWNHVEA